MNAANASRAKPLQVGPLLAAAFANAAALVWMTQIVTPYMVIASTAYSALGWGIVFRRDKKIHTVLMNLGILFDISLVGVLELQRAAIATAASFTLTGWQQGHIAASTLALLLYFPILWMGWGLYRGKLAREKYRSLHLRLGYAAFVLRTVGFLLMFSMLEHVTR